MAIESFQRGIRDRTFELAKLFPRKETELHKQNTGNCRLEFSEQKQRIVSIEEH